MDPIFEAAKSWVGSHLMGATTEKGDAPGHEFHGNQFSGGGGGGGSHTGKGPKASFAKSPRGTYVAEVTFKGGTGQPSKATVTISKSDKPGDAQFMVHMRTFSGRGTEVTKKGGGKTLDEAKATAQDMIDIKQVEVTKYGAA
jgi:hypothetical protein